MVLYGTFLSAFNIIIAIYAPLTGDYFDNLSSISLLFIFEINQMHTSISVWSDIIPGWHDDMRKWYCKWA